MITYRLQLSQYKRFAWFLGIYALSARTYFRLFFISGFIALGAGLLFKGFQVIAMASEK